MTTKTTAEVKLIAQARQYAIALGRDPARIKTVEDAERLLDSIADGRKQYGSD